MCGSKKRKCCAPQEQLGCEISGRYYSQWLCANWGAWHTWVCGTLGFSEHHFVKSQKALPEERDPRRVQEEYSLSSLALLALLLRWHTTLKGAGPKDKALEVLAQLLGKSLADKELVWLAPRNELLCKEPRLPPPAGARPVRLSGGRVVLDPLVGQARWLTSKPAQQLLQASDLGTFVMEVPAFLVYLQQRGSGQPRAWLTSLLCFLAEALESSTWLQGARADPLDLPVLKGAQRTRRLPASMKREVVALGTEQGLARSGAQMMNIIKRFKHFTRGLCSGGRMPTTGGRQRSTCTRRGRLGTLLAAQCAVWPGTLPA